MDVTGMTSSILVFLSVFIICLHQGSNTLAYYHGRHVCTERRQIRHPVPHTQSFKKPIYRRDLQKIVYVTTHKTVIKMEMRTQVLRKCCKGWEKRVPREVGCIKPVCRNKCLNGGRCIAPDLCMCRQGFTGNRCQTDINECAGRHLCQQRCINTVGTYECACQKGFKLSGDEMSCDLCLTCTPEFKSMQDQISTMGKEISDLQEDKKLLHQNLTIALGQYQEVKVKMEEVQSAQKATTSAKSTITHDVMRDEAEAVKLMPLDRLASLSQQISILEERMADCDCQQQYY